MTTMQTLVVSFAVLQGGVDGLSNQKHWSILAGLSLVSLLLVMAKPTFDDAIQDASDDNSHRRRFGDDDSGDESDFHKRQLLACWSGGAFATCSRLWINRI